MLQQPINFIEALGVDSIAVLWIPIGIWCSVALIIMGILRFADQMDSLYQYHIRAALILSLPAGIAGVQLIKWVGKIFVDTASSTFVPLVWVFESPIAVATGTPGESATIEWLPFVSGILLIVLFIISVLKLIRLATEAYLLSQFRRNNVKSPSSVRPDLDGSNLRLLNTMRFKPRLIFSARSSMPLTHGGFRPLVVIPRKLASSKLKMNMAVRHELIHIKRGDYTLNYFLMITRSLFWFIPVIYYLLDQLRMHREISCDREVLKEKNISQRSYAELLVELSTGLENKLATALSMSVHPSNLKMRIQSMKTQGKKRQSFIKSISFFTATLVSIALVISFFNVQDSKAGNPTADTGVSTSVLSGDTTDENENPDNTDEIPELIGGIKTFQTSIRYPEEARREGIEGLVVVQFTIGTEGEVEVPEVVRGIGGGCDEEALKTVKSAKFRTGKSYGDTKFQYSFLFRLAGADMESVETIPTDKNNADQESDKSGSATELGKLVIVGYGSSRSSAGDRVNNSEERINSLSKVIKSNPDNDSLYEALGTIYQNRSSALFEKRNRARNNEKAKSLDNRAREELQKAMNFYEKAAEINPGNIDYWKSLYRIYIALGMEAKAASAKEKAGLD